MVRATFAGFTTAFSALQANQKRLDITGQNLSNMNTPGYTRQALQTSSVNYTNPVSHYMNGSEVVVGFGVHMDKVTQIRDPYLDIQYRSQMNKSSYTDAMQASLDRLSDVLDESHVNGIWQAFQNIRNTLDNMQDPAKVDDAIFEAEFRSRMLALTNLLNDASKQIDEAEVVEYTKLDGRDTSEQGAVERVNDILRQVGNLNRQIKQNQIFGQQSLELMDERNVLLDELASYIPIEITYYKDTNYDGVDDGPLYNYDSKDNIIGKRDWPDDLRVEMVYEDKDGNPQRLTLVEGTVGAHDDNFGSLEIGTVRLDNTTNKYTATKPKNIPGDGITDANGILNIGIVFHKANESATEQGVVFSRTVDTTANPPTATITNHFPDNSGSIQASLDMLWKDGLTEGVPDDPTTTTINEATIGINDKRGYEYYRRELDNLAQSFAKVMNTLNAMGNEGHLSTDAAASQYALLAGKDGNPITAKNISISAGWQSGDVKVGKETGVDLGSDEKNRTATILNMLEAMKATYPDSNIKDTNGTVLFNDVNLGDNSFADYMNHISTILANDSYSNTEALKTNVTVLNGIEDSRDSVSGVSLDEEASNMMMYMAAYNAASRLMTTLDEALNTLINSTGVVGR